MRMEHPVQINGPATLTGTFYQASSPRAVAVLNGATGVPHRFYRHFAQWLANECAVSCLTYDYRDFGASAWRPIHMVDATMVDWGLHDTQAARDWLVSHAAGAPIWVLGHSLGGLLLARQKHPEQIARVITICSGPVHMTDHPWPFQASARALWFITGPLAVALWGYVPKRLSGLGTDIPGTVFNQWKYWCTTPGFCLTDAAVPAAPERAITTPLRAISLSDDPSVPPAAVTRMAQLYPGSEINHVQISAAAHGLGKVGHVNIFRPSNAALWPRIIDTGP